MKHNFDKDESKAQASINLLKMKDQVYQSL